MWNVSGNRDERTKGTSRTRMWMVYCRQCLEKQREIDDLKEKVARFDFKKKQIVL